MRWDDGLLEVTTTPPPTAKWRIEKITDHHGAHVNSPYEYPVGWWYAVQYDDQHIYLTTEFAADEWEFAIEEIERAEEDE